MAPPRRKRAKQVIADEIAMDEGSEQSAEDGKTNEGNGSQDDEEHPGAAGDVPDGADEDANQARMGTRTSSKYLCLQSSLS